jgi:hypothetical protein
MRDLDTGKRLGLALSVFLLCLAVGCQPTDSDYQIVTPDAPQEITPELTPEETATSPPETPVVAAQPVPRDPAIPTPEPASGTDNVNTATVAVVTSAKPELSINESRPFAVPLPEVIPVSAETSTAPEDPLARIKLLVPTRDFLAEKGALRVSFDDIDLLKTLNMEPVPINATDYFPDWLSGLNGQQIRLRGWMYPPAKSEGIARFLFVRDSGLCCFGARPRIYDKVAVRLKEGETTKHIVGRPFDVVGTLVIDPVVEDEEELFLLYHIEEATIAE